MLRTNWMFRGNTGEEQNDLLELMKSISKNPASDEALYANHFLHCIVESFWSTHQRYIFYVVFIPFLVYAFLCITFIPHLLQEFEEPFMGS